METGVGAVGGEVEGAASVGIAEGDGGSCGDLPAVLRVERGFSVGIDVVSSELVEENVGAGWEVAHYFLIYERVELIDAIHGGLFASVSPAGGLGIHGGADEACDCFEASDVFEWGEGSIVEAVFVNAVDEVGHEFFVEAEAAPDDSGGIIDGGVELAGRIGGEDEVFDIPGDEGEAAIGGAVPDGIPIVVGPIDVGSPEV